MGRSTHKCMYLPRFQRIPLQQTIICSINLFRLANETCHKVVATLHLREANFDLFKDLLAGIPWARGSEGKGAQESWLTFKHHSFQGAFKAGTSLRVRNHAKVEVHGWARSSSKSSNERSKSKECGKGIWPLGRSIGTLSGHEGMWWGRLRPSWN